MAHRIPQRLAEFTDCGVNAAVEAYEAMGPKFFLYIVACDDLTSPGHEQLQNLERLFLEAKQHSILP
jgi:hypothetical protein